MATYLVSKPFEQYTAGQLIENPSRDLIQRGKLVEFDGKPFYKAEAEAKQEQATPKKTAKKKAK